MAVAVAMAMTLVYSPLQPSCLSTMPGDAGHDAEEHDYDGDGDAATAACLALMYRYNCKLMERASYFRI